MDLQKFKDYLRTLDFDTLVPLWNEFCYNSDNGSADSIIYESVEDIHAQMIMDWCVANLPKDKFSTERVLDGLIWDEYQTY